MRREQTRNHRPRASKTWLESVSYALDGISYALYFERNMKIHFAVAAGVFLFELVVRPVPWVVAWTVFTAALVVAAELSNTAIERLTDLSVGTDWHELARATKDLAAGTVLTLAFGSVAVGAYLLWSTQPWGWRLFTTVHAAGAVMSGISLLVLCTLVVRTIRWAARRADQGTPPKGGHGC